MGVAAEEGAEGAGVAEGGAEAEAGVAAAVKVVSAEGPGLGMLEWPGTKVTGARLASLVVSGASAREGRVLGVAVAAMAAVGARVASARASGT